MAKPGLKVSTFLAGDVIVLRLAGTIQHGDGVVTLREHLRKLFLRGDKKVLLDLEKVTKVDDSALMDIQSTLLPIVQDLGCQLKAENIMNIKNVSEMSRLGMLLDCFESEPEALSAFA